MRPTALAAALLALLPLRQASAATVELHAGGSGIHVEVSTPSPYYDSPWGFGAGPQDDGPYGYWYAYPYDDWPNPYAYGPQCTPTWNGGIYCLPGGPPQYFYPGFSFGFGFGGPVRPPSGAVGVGPRRPGHGNGGTFHGDQQGRPMR